MSTRGSAPTGAAPPSDDRTVARAMRRFIIGSVVALAVLVVLIYFAGQRVARQQAVNEAEDRSRRLSQSLGALVTDGVRRREPHAVAPLDGVLESRFAEGYLWRAKIWDQDGTILWSDEVELVGQRFPLSREVDSLLGTTDVHVELVDLEDPENASERSASEMLEVYAGAFDANGEPVLVELYVSTKHMRSYEEAILAAFIPLGIVGLLLFQAAVLPLAVGLGRRVKRSEGLRARSTAHALQASELERKRIAEELHDGVVQDLAAVGFSLPGIRRSLVEEGDAEQAAQTLEQLQGIVRRDISALRSMMIDVYPPDLDATSLCDAIADLVAAGRVGGLDVRLDVVSEPDIPADHARLLYRVAREGLHNVAKHAEASHATVTLEARAGTAAVTVCDDGLGLRGRSPRRDSLGLRLLTESLKDAGGTLALRDGGEGVAHAGACLEAVLPYPVPRRGVVQGFPKGRLAGWWHVLSRRGDEVTRSNGGPSASESGT
jgi:signal transduction histidine kinase